MLDSFKYIICGEDYVTENGIVIFNPTVKQIRDYGSLAYQILVHTITMRAYDKAVDLWDNGIDYENVPDFFIFIDNIQRLSIEDTSILFGDLDFKKFELSVNETNLEPIITNGSLVIDSLVYREIVSYLRAVNRLSDKIEYKVGNKKAKEFLISRMRRKLQKRNKGNNEDVFANMCSALINRTECKYDYNSILELKISQFYDSFYRIVKIDEYKNHVMGLYCNSMAFNKVDNFIMQWYGSYEQEN